MARWSQKRARQWSNTQPWMIGCNYINRGAGNQLEMWSKETFDRDQIAEELGWAASIGMNAIRIFLHDLVWQEDPKGLLRRLDQVLTVANRRGVRAMIVFFDSVWHPFPRPGVQREPEPHVHNSMWVQSPGIEIIRNDHRFADLQEYVTEVVRHFRDDERVQVWDIWNEPDNINGMSYGPRDLGGDKIPLIMTRLPQVFEWARSAKPSQPLTSGVWLGNWESEETVQPHERMQIELSDVISFHNYGPPEDLERRIQQLSRYGRPLLCTEYMSRASGSTFEGTLPIFKKHNVGCYCWGLVNGRTQTIYPWDSWQKQYTGEPDPWFHDVFREDGSPYCLDEVKLIAELSGKSEVVKKFPGRKDGGKHEGSHVR